MQSNVKNIVYTAMFTAIIAVCSLITVPFAVPFTMQTFGVFFALLMLGGKRGAFAIASYIALGLAGLPVFSGFQGGLSAFFGATGGYIIGFLLAAAIFFLFEKLFGGKRGAKIAAVTLGMLTCYITGTAWYALVYMGGAEVGFAAALLQCVIPFVLPDAAKIALAFALCKKTKKYMK